MIVLVYIISLIWVAAGVCLILYTERTKEVSKDLFAANKLKAWAILPLFFGVVLVIGAFFQKGVSWLAFILGVLALLKGVYLIVGPPTQVRRLVDWWFDQASDKTIRLIGLIIFFLGSALFISL